MFIYGGVGCNCFELLASRVFDKHVLYYLVDVIIVVGLRYISSSYISVLFVGFVVDCRILSRYGRHSATNCQRPLIKFPICRR